LRPIALQCVLDGRSDEAPWLTSLIAERGGAQNWFAQCGLEEKTQDQWVSQSLIRLQLSHESPHLVAGTHQVSAALPQRRAILILGPEDLATPTMLPLGSATLRRRQLEASGWHIKDLFLQDVRAAELENRLDVLLSDFARKGP